MAIRRKGQGQGNGDDRVLVAAATKVPLNRKPTIKPEQSAQQKDALAYCRSVPEIKQLILWRANQIAKLRLYAATHPLDDPDGEPVPATHETSGINPELAKLAGEVIRSFRSNIGGQSALLRRLEMNLEAVGELWIVGLGEVPSPPGSNDPGEPEEWIVASISEIKHKQTRNGPDDPGVWTVHRHPKDKKGRELDMTRDDLFRIWMPDLEWGEMPDCALFGALGPLQQVQVLNDQLLAEARSRVPAGMFTVPNELTIGTVNTTDPKDTPSEQMMDTIVTAWTEAVYDPSDPATLAPLIIRGPKDALGSDVLRRIDLSRNTGEELDKRIAAVLERVFRGLDAPIEVIKGHMQTTYSNAEQIDEDVWEDHLEPRAVLVVDAVTVGYFREQLRKAATDAALASEVLDEIDRMFVWYDASDLVKQPNPTEHADKGLELGAIGSQAWRKATGYDESDKPDPAELLLRMALTRGPLAPNVVVALLRLIDPSVTIPEPVGDAGSATGAPAAASAVPGLVQMFQGVAPTDGPTNAARALAALASTSRRRGSIEAGRQLVDIDREFRNRVLVAADQAMTRALERAGNRVKSQTKMGIRDLVRNVPPLERVAVVGRDRLQLGGISTDSLLDGAFDALEQQYKDWGATAQTDAIELVNRLVGGFSQAQRDALGLRLSDSLDESWTWMKEALTSLAEGQLFDPSPSPTPIGEFDPTLKVPPSLVRQAVARAGGAAGLTSSDSGSAWVAIADSGTRPPGGIATGDIMRGALRDAGGGVEGYEWDYGRAQRKRPFEPHRELDGVQFVNFDDAVLANTGGWPEFPYYMPGDHDGCLCDVIPIVLSPGEAADLGVSPDDEES